MTGRGSFSISSFTIRSKVCSLHIVKYTSGNHMDTSIRIGLMLLDGSASTLVHVREDRTEEAIDASTTSALALFRIELLVNLRLLLILVYQL